MDNRHELRDLERAMARARSCRLFIAAATARAPSEDLPRRNRRPWSEVERLLHGLMVADLRAGAIAAAQCVRSAWGVCDAPAARAVVAAVEGWAAGRVPYEDVIGQRRRGRQDVRSPEPWLCYEGPGFPGNRVVAPDLAPNEILAAAAEVAALVPRGGARAAVHAAAAVATAAVAAHPPFTDRWRSAWNNSFEAHLAALHRLVVALRWPRTLPTPEQVSAAPPAVAVAWDRVSERDDGACISSRALVRARQLAAPLGLCWEDPVQRAVAERAGDGAEVHRLLAGWDASRGQAG